MKAVKAPAVKSVSFSGIDGAGKSTQIDALCAAMEARGLQVRLIRFWDDIAQFTRFRESAGHRIFKGDKGIGSPTAPIHRRDKNVRSWPMGALRLFLYLVDALALRNFMRIARSSGADLIVFDRFIYDELANLNLSNPVMRCYARFILRFVPRPSISFLLDADPETARSRKPEYPLEFVRVNRNSYLALKEVAEGLTVIRPNSIEEVKREVLTRAFAALRVEQLQGRTGIADADSQHEHPRQLEGQCPASS